MHSTLTWLRSWIKGEDREAVAHFTPGYKTVNPDIRLKMDEWLRKYRVSYMHGWRSNPIHIQSDEFQTLSIGEETRDA